MTQPSPSHRILAAVLFTDIVDSTAVAEELGDRRWKALIERHHRIVRRELKRFGGRELDTAGDGFFASFREPASAIGCACAVADAVRELGIEIRAGIHFGECERVGKKLAGITVVVGARIAALGGAGDVLVSGTAAELARGAGYGFEDRGVHVLKGVEGEWRVVGVTSVEGHPLAPTLAADEASTRRDALVAGGERRPRRVPIIAAAVLAAVAGVALAVMLTRSREAEVPGPDTVARIDALQNTFDRVVSVSSPASPQGIAFGAGKLWIVNVIRSTVIRYDPVTEEVDSLALPPASGPVAIGVSAAGSPESVWVAAGREPSVFLIDAAHPERPAETFGTGSDVPTALAVGPDGSAWITSEQSDSVLALAPSGTTRVHVVLGEWCDGPTGIAATADAVWVSCAISRTIVRLDPSDGSVVKELRVGGVPGTMAIDERGAVWVTLQGG